MDILPKIMDVHHHQEAHSNECELTLNVMNCTPFCKKLILLMKVIRVTI